jgi:hypothetical protein
MNNETDALCVATAMNREILFSLMYFAKRIKTGILKGHFDLEGDSIKWTDVAHYLEQEMGFGPDLKLGETLNLLAGAYQEAVTHPQLRVPNSYNAIYELIVSPAKGTLALEWPYWGMDLTAKKYSVEDIFNVYVAKMISDLMLTSVNDCPDYKKYSDTKDAAFKS